MPSAIYLVDATKTNDRSDDLTTSACCNNHYSVLAHYEGYNADTEIVHPEHTLPSVPSTGRDMVYDDYPNRADDVGDFLQSYLEEELRDLPDNLLPVSKNNNGENIIMPQLAPAIPSINLHALTWHILEGLCALVTEVLCPIFPST